MWIFFFPLISFFSVCFAFILGDDKKKKRKQENCSKSAHQFGWCECGCHMAWHSHEFDLIFLRVNAFVIVDSTEVSEIYAMISISNIDYNFNAYFISLCMCLSVGRCVCLFSFTSLIFFLSHFACRFSVFFVRFFPLCAWSACCAFMTSGVIRLEATTIFHCLVFLYIFFTLSFSLIFFVFFVCIAHADIFFLYSFSPFSLSCALLLSAWIGRPSSSFSFYTFFVHMFNTISNVEKRHLFAFKHSMHTLHQWKSSTGILHTI